MMQRRYSPFVPECWAERVRKHLEEVGRMANNMKLEEAIAHLDESLNDQSHDWGCEECKQEHDQLREWLVELEQLKESGAVVVVRCMDCKYCEYPAPNITRYRCSLFDRCVIADWFCASAERKDNGNA